MVPDLAVAEEGRDRRVVSLVEAAAGGAVADLGGGFLELVLVAGGDGDRRAGLGGGPGDAEADAGRAADNENVLAGQGSHVILAGGLSGRVAGADLRIELDGRPLEHDPEKWIPVFGKDHAPTALFSYGRVSRGLSVSGLADRHPRPYPDRRAGAARRRSHQGRRAWAHPA